MIMWAIQIFLAVAFGAMPMAIGIAPILTASPQWVLPRSWGSRGDAYDAWRVRGSFNDPRRVGDCRGSVPVIVVV